MTSYGDITQKDYHSHIEFMKVSSEMPPEDYQGHVDFNKAHGLSPGTTTEQYRAMQAFGWEYGILDEELIESLGLTDKTENDYVILSLGSLYRVDYDGNTKYLGPILKPPHVITDTWTGKTYRTRSVAFKALVSEYGLDVQDRLNWYKMEEKDPDRFKATPAEEFTGELEPE